MPRFVLIGLCEPLSDESQAAFDEWFIDQHIEDTTKCPQFVRGSVYKLAGPHLDLETKETQRIPQTLRELIDAL